MHCRKCGHDLSAVTSSRCSECGTFFDPNHPRTYLTAPQSGRVALKRAILGLVFVLLGLGAHVVMPMRVPWLPAVIAALLGAACLITAAALTLHVLVGAGRAVLGRVPWQVHEGCNVAAVVVAAAAVVVFVTYSMWT